MSPGASGAGTPIQRARSGLDACVHCGFCLQACPTYIALEDENDSPRGRLVLMRALADGEITASDPSLREHIDRCLGCLGCETACPSGVPYGHLLEATRATLRSGRAPSRLAAFVLWVFEHRFVMRVAMALARFLAATPIPTLAARLDSRYGFAMAMLASAEPPIERAPYRPAPDVTRERVALLHGCVMEGIFTETNRATERVLGHNGYRLVAAPGERCCGALHAHAGDLEGARRLARANIAAFERSGADLVTSNAAGCGAMLKGYGALLSDDGEWRERARTVSARARDVSELLAAAGPRMGAPLPLRVTYDPPCHLLHAQRVAEQPLDVLRAIPGLEFSPLADADQCCGSAGIYNLLEPETSGLVLEAKVERIAATGAALVATGNPGCLMQIGAGLLRRGVRTRAVHPVDLLDASYAGL